MLFTFFKGFVTGGSLIVAIGAQNAFVLSQGVRKNHVIIIPFICGFFDAVLITVGVSGVGTLASSSPLFQNFAAIGGAAFLLWYGLNSFKSALRGESMGQDERSETSLKAAILTTLAVTLLNPHVYLDTIVLMGSISSQFGADNRIFFGAGAAVASFVWFYSLSLGARFLEPLFQKEVSWRVLDTVVGLTMWVIAFTLIYNLLK